MCVFQLGCNASEVNIAHVKNMPQNDCKNQTPYFLRKIPRQVTTAFFHLPAMHIILPCISQYKHQPIYCCLYRRQVFFAIHPERLINSLYLSSSYLIEDTNIFIINILSIIYQYTHESGKLHCSHSCPVTTLTKVIYVQKLECC